MLNLLKKTIFFLFYFLNVLNFYLKGLIIAKTKIICSVIFSNFISIIYFLKYNLLSNFSSLLDIVVVDYINKYYNRYELTYFFWNIHYSYRLGLKLYTTQLNSILSISNYFLNANWLEREIWDMFGIKFILHTNLNRILTDYGFKGFPLRKDFPLSGYIDIFYDNSLQIMHYLPVEFAQNMRFFNLINPWHLL